MAVTYGFYNSLNGDRKYNAEDVSHIFNGIITDGVFSAIGDALMTVAGTGMQVVVKTGKCWFNGTWTMNDSLLPLDIDAADVSLTRIDAVVVEVDTSVATRANSIKIVKGTASANPTNPTMKSEEFVHQYPIAYVTVSAGVTSITADKISINVGRGSCPFITSVLQQTDVGDLFNQWEAEFESWFENVRTQLSGDVAANLQRQITENKNKIDSFLPNTSTRMILGLPEGATPNDAWQAQALGAGKRIVKVTVKWYLDQTPVQHMYITGGAVIPNHTLYTDENGECYISVDADSESIEVGLKNSANASYFINKKTISKTTTDVLFEIHKMTVVGSYATGETYYISMSLPAGVFHKIPEKDGDSNQVGSVGNQNGRVSVTAILVDDSVIAHASGANVTISGNYIDTPSKNISITLGNDTTAQAAYQFESSYRIFEYSGYQTFSPKVKRYDVHLVGGGGSGAYYDGGTLIGYPGDGGSNLLKTNISANTETFHINIGSGGSIPTTNGDKNAGGNTTISGGGLTETLTANGGGGSGGHGGGSSAGNGDAGATGVHLFNSANYDIVCDYGGHGGYFTFNTTQSGAKPPDSSKKYYGGVGGSGKGGKGGDAYFDANYIENGSYVTNASNATSYGCGGGGQAIAKYFSKSPYISMTKIGKPGAGYRGCVAFRWYY